MAQRRARRRQGVLSAFGSQRARRRCCRQGKRAGAHIPTQQTKNAFSTHHTNKQPPNQTNTNKQGVNTPHILKTRGLTKHITISGLLEGDEEAARLIEQGEMIPDTMVRVE